ncbi:sce7726 family protein [Bacillus sp. FJAT-27445]|uniref:sce7726 family protein n=1 Tax=Bacillus sp. FJAT-27445 TaxID=1679166 RepID=UPI000743D065|nr:sce7726 family protein [Bacillus sp. FJAT-27445]
MWRFFINYRNRERNTYFSKIAKNVKINSIVPGSVIIMNYMHLNRFFSKKNLMDTLFAEEFNLKIFKEEIYKNYDIMTKKYRNEFFFKNTLFNKLVLGRFSINTTAAYSEVAVGKSKADLVVINRTRGMVYEIKTDLDNLDRLVYQLEDYSKAFSEVYVVTSERNYYPVYRVLRESNPSVGIIVLTDKVCLSVRKEAVKDDSHLNHEVLFKLLRKNEYEQILSLKFGCLPEVKPVQYFKISLQWFKTLDVKEAQDMVLYQLQKRIPAEDYKSLKRLPVPIRWLIYTGNLKHTELSEIYEKLEGI